MNMDAVANASIYDYFVNHSRQIGRYLSIQNLDKNQKNSTNILNINLDCYLPIKVMNILRDRQQFKSLKCVIAIALTIQQTIVVI